MFSTGLVVGLVVGRLRTSPPPAKELARTKALILQFQKANDQAKSYPFALHAKIASEINPPDFAYIVEHDPDILFRGKALFDFGYMVAPDETFPTLARIARSDSPWNVRMAAIFSIHNAFHLARFKRRRPEAEQLAFDNLYRPVLRVEAIGILSYCHDNKAKRALRSIAANDKDLRMRQFAKKALRQEIGPGLGSP